MNSNQRRKNKRDTMALLIAITMALLVINLQLPESLVTSGEVTLSRTGQTSIGVLIFCLVLWMTEAIPFHITGLLGVFFMAIFQVDSFTEIVKVGFGNQIVIFFIGVLILSAYITYSGLGKRIAMFIVARTGNDTGLIILGFLLGGVFLSMWVTDMAVAAILMPLAKGILEEEGVIPLKSNFGKALMISCAWGPIIGGIATPAGCGANPLAIGFLRDMVGIEMTFLGWMTYGVPAAILLILPTWGLLLLFFKPEIKYLSKTKEELINEYRGLPAMNREEIITLVVFLLTIVLWLISPLIGSIVGISIPISMPVILTTALFFFPGMSKIRWSEIQPEISWSGIILVLSGISVGMMLYNSGAAKWLSLKLLGGIGGVSPFWQVFIVVIVVMLLKVLLASNTVTGTIVIPIVIALAQGLGLAPLTITLPAALTASLAFILVTSTPTNVIPYSAGYFSIADMAKIGLIQTIIATVIVSGSIYLIGRVMQLY